MTHMITYTSGRCTEGALCARRGDTPPYINHLFTARCAKTLPNPSLYGGALRHRGKTIIKHCPSLRGTSEERLCPNEAEGASHVGAGHLMQKTQKFLRRGVLSHTDCTDFTDWRVASLALSALPSACVPEAHARESMRVSVQSVRSA